MNVMIVANFTNRASLDFGKRPLCKEASSSMLTLEFQGVRIFAKNVGLSLQNRYLTTLKRVTPKYGED